MFFPSASRHLAHWVMLRCMNSVTIDSPRFLAIIFVPHGFQSSRSISILYCCEAVSADDQPEYRPKGKSMNFFLFFSNFWVILSLGNNNNNKRMADERNWTKAGRDVFSESILNFLVKLVVNCLCWWGSLNLQEQKMTDLEHNVYLRYSALNTGSSTEGGN